MRNVQGSSSLMFVEGVIIQHATHADWTRSWARVSAWTRISGYHIRHHRSESSIRKESGDWKPCWLGRCADGKGCERVEHRECHVKNLQLRANTASQNDNFSVLALMNAYTGHLPNKAHTSPKPALHVLACYLAPVHVCRGCQKFPFAAPTPLSCPFHDCCGNCECCANCPYP